MPEIVFALYRPHAGKEAEVRNLIAQHVPALQRLELATERKPVIVKSKNGTYIEIFEWVSNEAMRKAHVHPEVAKVWEAMGKVADFASLDSLPESKQQFQHFEAVDL